MQAMVWTESAGSTKWQATVDRIDRIADTNSGTYGVRLSMNNPDHLIPVGLRCRWIPRLRTSLQTSTVKTRPRALRPGCQSLAAEIAHRFGAERPNLFKVILMRSLTRCRGSIDWCNEPVRPGRGSAPPSAYAWRFSGRRFQCFPDPRKARGDPDASVARPAA